MDKARIVVAGGGYAGVLAAIRAAKLAKDTAEVVLVNDRDTFVERIRLHEHAARGRQIEWSIPDLLRGTAVQFRRGMVTDVDRRRKVVLLDGGELPYDKLILALGSTTDMSRQPEGAREHAVTLDFGNTERLRGRLQELSAVNGRVTICGGGLVGVELSAEVAEEYPTLTVTLITEGEIAPMLLPRGRDKLRELLAAVPVHAVEHASVARIESTHVLTRDGRRVAHDVCITAAGMRPSPVAARAELPTNALGQAFVDPFLRSIGDPDVYVAGDAAVPVVDPGSRIAMGCKYGMPMAAQAATNAVSSLVGRPEGVFDFDDTHFMISIGRRNALVQLTHQRLILTGRLAVFIKEMTNRSTLWSFRWERSRWFNYPYGKTGRAPASISPEVVARALGAAQ